MLHPEGRSPLLYQLKLIQYIKIRFLSLEDSRCFDERIEGKARGVCNRKQLVLGGWGGVSPLTLPRLGHSLPHSKLELLRKDFGAA